MNGSRWTIPHATVHERREQFGVQTMELFQSHSINLRCATEEEIFVGIVQTLNKNWICLLLQNVHQFTYTC